MGVRIDTYKHLVQKKDLCGPTCLQMVLFRRGVWMDQEELAHLLRTKILFQVKDIYLQPFEAVDPEHPELGLDPKNFQAPLVLNLLKEHGLLSELYFPTEVKDLRKIIFNSLSSGHDVIVNIKLTCFFPNRFTGHYVLICEYDEEKDIVTLLDPDFQNKKSWSCTVEQLIDSMGDHWDGKQRGIVVVREISEE